MPDRASAPRRLWLVAAAALAGLVVTAVGRLHYAIPHLVSDVAEWSAVDLRYRFNEVAAWFSGQPVYGVVDGAVYPPASHTILWPLLGWPSWPAARWLWLITTLLAALAIAIVLHRAVRTARAPERAVLVALVFAAYPLQQAIFVGQMGVHVAALVALGAACLFRRPGSIGWDLAAGALLAAALVKPTLGLPLVAVTLVASGRWRPALITAGVYGALTGVAAAAQPAGLLALTRAWLEVSSVRVPFQDGVPNLHMLLAAAGLDAWLSAASLAVLATLLVWTWWHRHADPWLLLGVAAVTTRFWAHSTLYDDAFLVLPVLALARLVYDAVAGPAAGLRSFTGGLLIAGSLCLLTPTWAVYDSSLITRWSIHAAHTVIWLVVLVHLARTAPRLTPSGAEA